MIQEYLNTPVRSARTMEIAGKLMAKGIDFGSIIDNSFYKKTYVQNQILGRALSGEHYASWTENAFSVLCVSRKWSFMG